MRPLAVTTNSLRPGGKITIVGPRLGSGPTHDALVILSGPGGYRATRLLHISRRTAGAVIHLPRRIAAGKWMIAVQDLSQLHATNNGHALIDLAVFTHR